MALVNGSVVVNYQGQEYELQTYKSHGKDILYESSVVDLAFELGFHSLCIESITPFNEHRARKNEEGTQQKLTPRYVAVASCIDAQGRKWTDVGSAGDDSLDTSYIRPYAPEMAAKRARVRVILLALNLKGYNADVEFSDYQGDSRPAPEPVEDKSNCAVTEQQKRGLVTIVKSKNKGKEIIYERIVEDIWGMSYEPNYGEMSEVLSNIDKYIPRIIKIV